MKKALTTYLALVLCVNLHAQNIKADLEFYLQELRDACGEYKGLWDRNLYAPVLLVQPSTRRVISNYTDTSGILLPDQNLFTGNLPASINIANTALHWGGRRWAMIMLPLPADKNDRLNLLSHELFHVAQPALGFSLYNPDNNHLDQSGGRIYLRLELLALLEAIKASDNIEVLSHLRNAFSFRRQRQLLYRGSDSSENLLELNEGIAEYTGVVVSGRDRQQMRNHFISTTTAFFNNATFVRSFAYQTTPMYGYLLSKLKNQHWNKEITIKTNLTDYFIKSFSIRMPADIQKAVDKILPMYGGDTILTQEKVREEKQLEIVAGYKKLFIQQAHFEIRFENMNVSFDPGNITPLEDKGTVYPTIRVSDNWGVLTVTKGALMAPNWDHITITPPEKTQPDKVTGDGWILELKPGYRVVKNEDNNNFYLAKK